MNEQMSEWMSEELPDLHINLTDLHADFFLYIFHSFLTSLNLFRFILGRRSNGTLNPADADPLRRN